MRMTVDVRVSGPLFANGLNAVLERTVQQLMETGHDRLNDTLRMRPQGVYLSVSEAQKGKASVGHYRRSLHTERKGMSAVIDDGRVVYGPWLEGISSRNQRTRFKGYASFRRVGQYLQRLVPSVLTKNIQRLVR